MASSSSLFDSTKAVVAVLRSSCAVAIPVEALACFVAVFEPCTIREACFAPLLVSCDVRPAEDLFFLFLSFPTLPPLTFFFLNCKCQVLYRYSTYISHDRSSPLYKSTYARKSMSSLVNSNSFLSPPALSSFFLVSIFPLIDDQGKWESLDHDSV